MSSIDRRTVYDTPGDDLLSSRLLPKSFYSLVECHFLLESKLSEEEWAIELVRDVSYHYSIAFHELCDCQFSWKRKHLL
jgi:hypothetical protein